VNYLVGFTCKIKCTILLLAAMAVANMGSSQVLLKSIPFTSATPFHEPDGRKEYVKVDDYTFITISKVKGNIGGNADYLLEKYNTSLDLLFSIPFKVDATEEMIELYVQEKKLYILSIVHDENAKIAALQATVYNVENGLKEDSKILFTEKIFPWVYEKSRGAIKQNFNQMICAAIGRNFSCTAPYRIEIRFSPDKQLFAAYLFDFSQRSLNGKCYVFDRNLQQKVTGNIHVDNNFTNYDVRPNNRGEVFILNGDKSGKIAVIQYQLDTRKYKYLDIQNASAKREGLTLSIFSDDIVYVANVIIGNNKLSGVMYSKFNFTTNLVERINIHDLSEGVKQTMEQSWEYVKQTNKEHWINYELTEFEVSKSEEIFIALEQREIRTSAYPYDPSNVVDLDKWKECTGNVFTGGIFLFRFNSKDDLNWENAYAKSQTADLNTGVNSASYAMDINHNNRLRMIFSTSDNATGIFNTLNYIEWDKVTGKKTKEMKLPNDDQIGLVRSYTYWHKDLLILVGRKGILGKKSIMNSYQMD
jgi:hypothetical protein